MKQDINSLKINLTFEEIAKMSKYNLKYILKTAGKEEAFKYLRDIQSGHSKTRNLDGVLRPVAAALPLQHEVHFHQTKSIGI